jgi:autotransporter-associated beta strand protein
MGNWLNGIVPANAFNVDFPGNATSFTSTNNITGLVLSGLMISSSGYTISGNAVSFSSIDASQSSGSSTVDMPIDLIGSANVGVDNSGASLSLLGVLSGSAGLIKNGAGTLELTAANTYTAATAINDGTVIINGVQESSPVTVASGATLAGVGSVEEINSTGGTVSPGNAGPGILIDAGNFDLGPDSSSNNSTYSVELDGTTPGNGANHYSQTQVGGTIDLSGVKLNVTLGPDFTPAVPRTFTIIQNNGTSKVTGTFNNQPEGSTIVISGVTFQISYIGGTNSTSVVLNELNNSNTSLAVSPSSATYGESVKLTATVTGPAGATTPAGTVQFLNNGTSSLGSASLTNGVANLSTTILPLGTNSITAKYIGNGLYIGSTSTAMPVTVTKATTTTKLMVSPSSPAFGAQVTLLATITPGTTGTASPTGKVSFYNGSKLLGTGTVAGEVATFVTNALPAGTSSLTAQYSGDTNYDGSTSPPVSVTVSQIETTTVVKFSPTLPVSGQVVTLTATITPVTTGPVKPTGTVQFFVGSTLLGSGSVANDTATLNTTALTVGNNSVTAKYLGDTNYAGSTSMANVFAVVLAATTTTLSLLNPSPAPFQTVTLTATVTVNSPGAGTPTGTVTFLANGTPLGTANVSNGTAKLSISLPIANNSLTAMYSGDSKLQASTSAAITDSVGTANQQWLNQVSLVLLDRAPTQAELTHWIDELNSGRSRHAVVAGIANSPQAQNANLQNIFQDFLGRKGSTRQLVKVVNASASTHTSPSAVVLGSKEYFEQSGGTLGDFLNSMLAQVIGNTVPQAYLELQLAHGILPLFVAEEVLQSNAGKAGLVTTNFQNTLRRSPTAQEKNAYVEQMNEGLYLRQLIAALLAGKEFYDLSTSSAAG